MLASEFLAGGFANPVFDAQSIFRAVMDGFANTGTIRTAISAVSAPDPLGGAAASILLTLCDFESNVWLSPTLATQGIQNWISFHAGAPLIDKSEQCAFAFVASTSELPPLSAFAAGNDEYPDTSTTIIMEVNALTGGAELVLEGPGINGQCSIAPIGLPDAFIDIWATNGALYPCGVDLILTAGDAFLCLPRTTRIAEA